jgi:FkbM family methyltransferase
MHAGLYRNGGARPAIELVAYYEEFRDRPPQCELKPSAGSSTTCNRTGDARYRANVGYYTILFAQLASRGRLAEPTSTAGMLQRNLGITTSTALRSGIALGAVTGSARTAFIVYGEPTGRVKTIPFPTRRLPRAASPARIDCLKIDVAKFRFEVLRGAERTLLKYDPFIVIELNDTLPSATKVKRALGGLRSAAATKTVLDREFLPADPRRLPSPAHAA